MILNVFESVSKVANNVKEWMIANGNNPFLWVGLFMLGLAVFAFTYRALNKNR